MALNVTPFVGTDNFNMETFNNMISQINSGVNSEISGVLAQLGTKARIQTGSYDGKDGKKVYTTDVVANRVEFLTKPNSGGRQEEQKSESVTDAFIGVDEDLPF